MPELSPRAGHAHPLFGSEDVSVEVDRGGSAAHMQVGVTRGYPSGIGFTSGIASSFVSKLSFGIGIGSFS